MFLTIPAMINIVYTLKAVNRLKFSAYRLIFKQNKRLVCVLTTAETRVCLDVSNILMIMNRRELQKTWSRRDKHFHFRFPQNRPQFHPHFLVHGFVHQIGRFENSVLVVIISRMIPNELQPRNALTRSSCFRKNQSI